MIAMLTGSDHGGLTDSDVRQFYVVRRKGGGADPRATECNAPLGCSSPWSWSREGANHLSLQFVRR